MKRTRWSILLISLLVLLLVAGCTSAPAADTDPDASTPAGTTDGGDATGTEPADDDGKMIGMVVKDVTAEYVQAMIVGAEQTCAELGIELKIIDGGTDNLKIMNAIDQFIMQGIDGFIIAAVEDPIAVIPGIQQLNDANIPVFALDTCPEGGVVDMFITFDIVESTKRAAGQMIEGIKSANNGEVPEGVVIEITGALVDMFAKECSRGLEEALAEYPQLTIVQGEGKWYNDDAFARTGDLLTRYGSDVVAVYCQTPDIMGSGTIAAIEAAGLNPADYFVCGICLGSEGIELLKSGKLYSVVEQPALSSAILAVRYLNDLFDGREIPKVGDNVEEAGELWSPAYVTENEYADGGATMILQGPLVPQEIASDDPRLWENILFGS